PSQRAVGTATFDVRGTTVSAIAQPYRFYLLKRAQDEFAAMNEADRAEVTAMLEAAETLPVMEATTTREIGIKDNLEVWL
ncbi:MAG: glutathione S-transferase family protein, partial [Pseudomonadota bacterium]